MIASYRRQHMDTLFNNYFPRAELSSMHDPVYFDFYCRIIIPKASTGVSPLCFVFYPGLEHIRHPQEMLKEEVILQELEEIDYVNDLKLPIEASWQLMGSARLEIDIDDKDGEADNIVRLLDYKIEEMNDLTISRYLPNHNREIEAEIDDQT